MSKTGRTASAHENDVSGTPAPHYNRDTGQTVVIAEPEGILRFSRCPVTRTVTSVPPTSATRILSRFCAAAVIALSPDDQS
jgi:hypothetical protein